MSGYPPEMQESIRKVEATRARRLKETFPAMSMEERDEILHGFHPVSYTHLTLPTKA